MIKKSVVSAVFLLAFTIFSNTKTLGADAKSSPLLNDKYAGWEYVGSVINGLPEGKGVLTSPEGRKFEGEFKLGKLARGTMTWLGSTYEGEFDDNLNITGRCVLTTDDGYKNLVVDGYRMPLTVFLSSYCAVDKARMGDRGYSKKLIVIILKSNEDGYKVIEWSKSWQDKVNTTLNLRNKQLTRAEYMSTFSGYINDNWDEIDNSAGTLLDSIQKKQQKTYPALDARNQKACGTGFAIAKDIVITAFHYLEGSADIEVKFEDSDFIKAELIRYSKATDLAVLKIKGQDRKEWLNVDVSPSAEPGTKVFTVEYPAMATGMKKPGYISGTVGSANDSQNDFCFMQVKFSGQPSGFGGPLLNRDGQLVGVMVSSSGSAFMKYSGSAPQNISWAAKADYLLPMIKNYVAPNSIILKASEDKLLENVKSALCLVRAK